MPSGSGQNYFSRGFRTTDNNFISRADFDFSHQLHKLTWWLSNIFARNSTTNAYFGNLVLRVASSMVSSHGWLFKSRFRPCKTKLGRILRLQSGVRLCVRFGRGGWWLMISYSTRIMTWCLDVFILLELHRRGGIYCERRDKWVVLKRLLSLTLQRQ